MIKKQIPNCITLLNLLCGCLAVVCALKGLLNYAVGLIILGAVFDFFDGMSARLLKVQSPMGIELDSLADVVTFGVAPGMLAFVSLNYGFANIECLSETLKTVLPFAAFLIPMLSAYRLAKFNIDTRQTTSFIGLPTPANAIFWCGLILINGGKMMHTFLTDALSCVVSGIYAVSSNVWFLFAMVFIFSVLLVSEIPLFSLKFKNLKWQDNKIKFIFLGSSLLLLVFLNTVATPLIILLYILLSIVKSYFCKTNNSPENQKIEK